MCEYLYVYIHSIYREKLYRRSLVLILRGYTQKKDGSDAAAPPPRASASSWALVQTPEPTLLRGPVRCEHCHDQPGRSAERESTDRSPSSPVKDCNQFFTAILCRDPQKKRRGAEQQTLPSNAKKRAQMLFRGHLSAFVRVLNPVPRILTRTRIMAENLSLPDVRTIARLMVGVLRAREAVSRNRVYTHICPHV